MTVQLQPTKHGLNGSLDAIPSKSEIHRLLCAALLSDSTTEIKCGELSNDIKTTLHCAEALGCRIELNSKTIKLYPPTKFKSEVNIFCGECGSTARFMLPIAASICDSFTLDGKEGLRRRPMKELCEVMRTHGCSISSDFLPLVCKGRLTPGNYTIRGDVSSQYITGLLMAAASFGDGYQSKVRVTGNFESKGYVELTVEILKTFGITIYEEIEQGDTLYTIISHGYHSSGTVSAGGDWSNMAAWLCSAAIKGNVQISGLSVSSSQRDRRIVELLKSFGAYVESGCEVCAKANSLNGIEIDAYDIPDLVPVLAAVAALSNGKTVISGASRLRIKESDRIVSTSKTLSDLGADITPTDDGFIINGKPSLIGGRVSGLCDHRIVMCAAVAASGCETPVIIDGAETVSKSYPTFFDDYAKLGGIVHVF